VNPCPYCGVLLQEPTFEQLPDAQSQDHIISEFQGGRKTIPACRGCNSTFDHAFEGRMAQSLMRLYVQLAKWGVPLPEIDQWWRAAYAAERAVFDLSVGPKGITARAARPIVIYNDASEIEEAYFATGLELTRFKQTMALRQPDALWIPAEKRVETTLQGLNLQLEIGPDWQQSVLKSCIAASTLLSDTRPQDRRMAGEILRAPASDPHPIVPHYFYQYREIDLVRPELAHTIYVEHVDHRLCGVVQVFGTFQFFCVLSSQTELSGSNAILGWADPVESREHWEMVQPIGLKDAPPSFDLHRALVAMIGRFHHAAVQRGTATNHSVVLKVGLPTSR
jgi:hypothetical protein